jgi:hypothetical protein
MVDLRVFMDVPILEVPATPVPISTCSQYTTPETCGQHSECIWSYRTAGLGVCHAK